MSPSWNPAPTAKLSWSPRDLKEQVRLIVSAIFGALIVAVILWEAFETVVLPRRVARRFRLTRLVYRSTWAPWKAVAGIFRRPKARETFLSFYGPLSLLILFAVWAACIITGFAVLYYSCRTQDSTHPTFETCLYLSGTTMFTLGLGDVIPHTWLERFFAVAESGLGFGFLALILSYLPVIYQAFSRREVNIVLLDARAGSPPASVPLHPRERPVPSSARAEVARLKPFAPQGPLSLRGERRAFPTPVG